VREHWNVEKVFPTPFEALPDSVRCTPRPSRSWGGTSHVSAAQNPAQYMHAGPRKGSQHQGAEGEETAFCGAIQGVAAPCDHTEPQPIPPRGGEHTEKSAPRTAFSQERGTVNQAISPDLADIVNAWPSLPEPFRAVMRASVLAMAKALNGDK
jgi:hypothetical protein